MIILGMAMNGPTMDHRAHIRQHLSEGSQKLPKEIQVSTTMQVQQTVSIMRGSTTTKTSLKVCKPVRNEREISAIALRLVA